MPHIYTLINLNAFENPDEATKVFLNLTTHSPNLLRLKPGFDWSLAITQVQTFSGFVSRPAQQPDEQKEEG